MDRKHSAVDFLSFALLPRLGIKQTEHLQQASHGISTEILNADNQQQLVGIYS